MVSENANGARRSWDPLGRATGWSSVGPSPPGGWWQGVQGTPCPVAAGLTLSRVSGALGVAGSPGVNPPRLGTRAQSSCPRCPSQSLCPHLCHRAPGTGQVGSRAASGGLSCAVRCRPGHSTLGECGGCRGDTGPGLGCHPMRDSGEGFVRQRRGCTQSENSDPLCHRWG